MKKNIFRALMIVAACFGVASCGEDPFSEGYDIKLPVASVTSISKDKPYVGDTITLVGENLNTVSTISIGVYNFKIVAQKSDPTHLVVVVPRIVEQGPFVIMNKYEREFITLQVLKPQFYPAVVETWPTEIEKGKAFTLRGKNMDLIKEVKINGTTLSLNGSATANQASYSSSGLQVELGQMVTIEVTPKNGEKQVSSEIKVVAPKATYIPRQTLMLMDFDAPFTPVNGDAEGKGYSYQYKVVNGQFGKALEVTAASANGWNGIYLKVENDNGGQGFDLSSYNKPYITFLVNTNGGQGYVQPILTANGKTEDRHFTGAYGYGDDYKVKTNGWEWRSYDLTKMGFPVVKGKLEKIGIQFRGGNVNGTPFYIAVDQVMITDGPLTPTLIHDMESATGGDLPIIFNGGSNLQGYFQGNRYITYKYTVGSDTWAWLGNLFTSSEVSLDPLAYSNGVYLNFLVNTGSTEGYAGFQFVQGSNKLANQKLDGTFYGDNYKFKPTNGKWEWRSIKFDKDALDVWGGSAANFDISKPFTVQAYARGGNIAAGVQAEINLDYFIFTTVPLDPNLDMYK